MRSSKTFYSRMMMMMMMMMTTMVSVVVEVEVEERGEQSKYTNA